MKPPEETFSSENLPSDLKWLIAHYKIQTNDPLIVILAWHHKQHEELYQKTAISQEKLESAVSNLRDLLSEEKRVSENLSTLIKSAKSVQDSKGKLTFGNVLLLVIILIGATGLFYLWISSR